MIQLLIHTLSVNKVMGSVQENLYTRSLLHTIYAWIKLASIEKMKRCILEKHEGTMSVYRSGRESNSERKICQKQKG